MKKNDASDARIEAAGQKGFSLISDETLLALYGNLLRARMLSEWSKGRSKGSARSGYEAATVGVTMDLGPGDSVESAGGDALPQFLVGEPLKKLLPGSTHELSAADRLHLCLGWALTHKASKDAKVSVVFWKEGAGDHWRSALEIARIDKLPIVFVSHVALNGQVAVEKSPRKTKPGAELLPGTEMPHITVDGADAVAVYRVAHESIERARRDRGPTLIDCRKFDGGGKRGRGSSSVGNMEAYLRHKGLFKKAMKEQVLVGFAADLKMSTSGRKG